MPDSEPLSRAERSEGTAPGGVSLSATGSGMPVRDAATVVSGGSTSRRVLGQVEGPYALPEPGQRIDCFELVESIGVGGMGAVYRAQDSRLERMVALKLLPPGQAVDPEVVRRFYQEGRAAARLDHENIARVYTIGYDAGYHFIAFEYIEGTTIRQRVERGGVPPVGEAINHTLQIANALVHANERGVVHRDVKPSNIIITPFGRAKLVDMGLARRFERDGDDGLTQSGMTLGTFDYISPEQARDPRDVDVRSDLYSLGCTLFYLLTGRPPFPEGTVLQKLLHHQEDTPPDVRALNPKVPADLASIVEKLMAKDRDRRYQTPEQLVRDLLIVAGALGLRSPNPEGLVWMTATPPPAWERHLVWGIPALAFSLVVATLIWWGQDESTPTSLPDAPLKWTASSKPLKARAPRSPLAENVAGASEVPKPDPTDVARSSPRDISVSSDEDLLSVLTSAPPGSVVTLAEDGPYTLGGGRTDRRTPARFLPQDLTIKAEPGVRPVLLVAHEPDGLANSERAVLDVRGGRLTLEGLEFVIESEDRDTAALRTEDTQLTVRRCLFRRNGLSAGRGRMAALHVRSTTRQTAGEGRRAAVVADACHFDAGQVGVLADGPVDVLLRDCTLAANGPAFWFHQGAGAGPIVADLSLHHVSILAGEGPVFRFEGTAPRVVIEDSAIAPPHDSNVTLVATDDPGGLDWRGRGNLYSRVGTFLQPTGPRSGREAIRDPNLWAEDASVVRESASTTTHASVWEATDPEQALVRERNDPGQALRLAAIPRGTRPPGARQGPLGTLAAGVALAANIPVTRGEQTPPPENSRSLDGRQDPREPGAPMPMPIPRSVPFPLETADGASPAVPTDSTDFLPMDVDPSPRGSEDSPRVGTEAEPEPFAQPRAESTPNPDVSTPPVGSNPVTSEAGDGSPPPLHTAEEFRDTLGRSPARGQSLLVAADADWVLASTQLRGEGRWSLRAAPGQTRPRIRFRPTPADPKEPTAPSVWLELRAGALQLEGIDIVLPRSDAPREGRWAAFAVWAGADLSLTNCTVTIEGDETNSAAVVLRASEDQANGGGAGRNPLAATIRLSNSLLRSGGDLIDVAPGRRLDLELNNLVVSTGGSLVHAHGSPRGQFGAPIKLNLGHVSARVAGGLILLESAPDEPELPVVDIVAHDSVFATTPEGAPLFRVDGQDALTSLRDRIHWEGNAVAYHQIDTYRRDQSAQPGAIPTSYDLQSWQVAVGLREASPVHGDLKFVKEWDATRPAWSLQGEDLRLSPESPASSSGADLQRIPPAPPSKSP